MKPAAPAPVVKPADDAPLGFTLIARTLLTTFGALAAVIGVFGLCMAMATSIAAPAMAPLTAVLAGSVLFLGGCSVISHAWARSESLSTRRIVRLAKALAFRQGGAPNLRPVT